MTRKDVSKIAFAIIAVPTFIYFGCIFLLYYMFRDVEREVSRYPTLPGQVTAIHMILEGPSDIRSYVTFDHNSSSSKNTRTSDLGLIYYCKWNSNYTELSVYHQHIYSRNDKKVYISKYTNKGHILGKTVFGIYLEGSGLSLKVEPPA